MKSSCWNIPINVENIRKNEEDELNNIISNLQELKNINKLHEENSSSEETISNENNDLSTIIKHTKLGQSSLRKRIEMSGKFLGLNFDYEFEDEGENNLKSHENTNKSKGHHHHNHNHHNNHNNHHNKERRKSVKEELLQLEEAIYESNLPTTTTTTDSNQIPHHNYNNNKNNNRNTSHHLSLPNLNYKQNINTKIKDKYLKNITFKKLEASLNSNEIIQQKRNENQIDDGDKNNKKTEILNKLKKKYNLNMTLSHELNHNISSGSIPTNGLFLQSPSLSMNYHRVESDQFPSNVSDHSIETPKTPFHISSGSHFNF